MASPRPLTRQERLSLDTVAEAVAKCPSFAEVLEMTASAMPDRTFLIHGEERLSFGAFTSLVGRCCRYLAELGLRPGDVVSAVLRNSPDFLILYFAALRARIVFNPFPFHLGAAEVLEKAGALSPKAVFCHKTHAPGLALADFPVLDLDSFDMGFRGLLAGFPEDAESPAPVSPDAVAVMYYSSGTTGKSKIIEYSHAAQVAGQASMLRAGFARQGGTHLCVLPLGHTSALRYTVKQCVCTGSAVVLHESFWKVRGRIWEEIAARGVTFMQTVPSILVAMLNTPYPDFRPEMAASMDYVGCGSSFLPLGLQKAFGDRFAVRVANLYGLSETGATHFDDPRDAAWVPGSVGRPFDVVRAGVFGQDGEEVRPGETGEIGVTGPTLLRGYFGAPELLTGCLRNGYFMTGDLGSVDAGGVWRYVDRIKDLIIKGGVNIVPSQIDEALQEHPDVLEAAAVGAPDMLMGETVVSYVVLKPEGRAGKKELIAWCRARLGDFKAPSRIEFIDALPKGPSGKILKRELREREAARAIGS
jgi:long-chain acyl-CoA synthetase